MVEEVCFRAFCVLIVEEVWICPEVLGRTPRLGELTATVIFEGAGVGFSGAGFVFCCSTGTFVLRGMLSLFVDPFASFVFIPSLGEE